MILQPLLHSRPFFLAWLERLWWFLVTRVVGAKGARGDSAPLPILRDHLTLSQPEGAYHVNYITAGPPDFQTFLRSCNFTTAMTETNWFVQTMNQPNFIMGLFSQVLTTQCRNQILLFWFFFRTIKSQNEASLLVVLYFKSEWRYTGYQNGPLLKSSLDASTVLMN